jgi:hypothetical protein
MAKLETNAIHAIATMLLDLLDRVALTPTERVRWQGIIDAMLADKSTQVKIAKSDVQDAVKAVLPDMIQKAVEAAVADALAKAADNVED